MKPHQEAAFEATIEAHLLRHGGWLQGDAASFDRERALDPRQFFTFVKATQPELWAELRNQHGASLEAAILDKLCKELDHRGSLDVMRHGFRFYGKTLKAAYFKPAHSLNPDILTLYNANRLVVTRQVKCAPASEESIDLLLSLNGIPAATAELKNPLTGQSVRNAIQQYQARDPKLPLFQFKKRALVHLAIDPDLVYMATRLAGKGTVFLPFNRGHQGGAGNPPHPSGQRSAYLWEEVLARDSFLDLIARFIHLERIEEKTADGKTRTKETLIFPRYHQLDAVRQLEAAARTEGPGHQYLIQHSAGSGKSNSIGWLAHRLASLHDAQDRKVFDSVVVITDRRVLDRQLQDTIYQFEHKQGVVARIDQHSGQLAEALAAGTAIIITTLQKFPFVTDKIGALPNRCYALIVDEAHGSQTGEAARSLKEVLALDGVQEAASYYQNAEFDAEEDDEAYWVQVMQSRGRQQNLSFFAFTATPKAKTLELFGRQDDEGKTRPFHLYSMRQAIEEGFILDVLRHYTTYQSFYRLAKQMADDPELDKKQASKALARFISLHPTNVAQKVQLIAEHFRSRIRHKIDGGAKAMVVTNSRLHAVRYKLAFDRYLKEQRYSDIRTLVAFSGSVRDNGLEYSEAQMNGGISETALREEFAKPDYHLLIVANKYQTGFDQPLLHTLYVDKRLAGVQAVQTLSRLNRTCPGKEDTFVLDFVNDAGEIQRSFQPYYEQTSIAECADPADLDRLKHELDAMQVYWQSEVEAFAQVFYKPKAQQREADNAAFYRHINPAVERFTNNLSEEEQDSFRDKLGAYVRLYAFLSQIMPYTDAEPEKRYTFGRFLLLRLPRHQDEGPLAFDDEVTLTHIHRKKTFAGSIALHAGEEAALKGPTDVGTGKASAEQAKLSAIIDLLNERFGTDFKPEDQITIEQFIADAKAKEDIQKKAKANSFENFSLSLKQPLEGILIDRMERNEALVSRYLNDAEFQDALFKLMAERLYKSLRGGS